MKKNILIAIILIIMGVWWAYMTKGTTTVSNGNATNTPSQIVTTATSAPIDFLGVQLNTDDWKTYTDQKLGYHFKYPPDWKVSEIKNPDFPEYESIISVHPANIAPTTRGYYEHVGVLCCVGPKYRDVNNLASTSGSNANIQVLDVNGNKVIVENNNELGIPATVSLYLMSGRKIFEFDVMTPGTYSEEAYRIAVGMIRNFYVVK